MGYINKKGSGNNVALDKREKLSLAFGHLPGTQETRKERSGKGSKQIPLDSQLKGKNPEDMEMKFSN